VLQNNSLEHLHVGTTHRIYLKPIPIKVEIRHNGDFALMCGFEVLVDVDLGKHAVAVGLG